MRTTALWILAAAALACAALAEPAPEPAKGLARRSSFFDDEHLALELRQAAGDVELANDDELSGNKNKPDASSGRLFLKKFLLFRNMFGNSNQQPVIPIIITGAGTGTGTTATAPTTTITSTGSIPSAEGTITTSPTTGARQTIRKEEEEQVNVDDGIASGGADEAVGALDVQALQAALAAGAQEYVVTDQEIHGTSDSKSSRQSASNINLRRKGSKNGQVISVRIPPKYRRYFKAGQRVMLNTNNNRPPRRRVVKKRVNKNRRKNGNRNKNKNNRLG